MNGDVDFDRFVEAVKAAGLASEHGVDVIKNWESVPLTHSSGVTPKDWERVQETLNGGPQ
ncbi:hypothetical protein ACFPOI_43735 [Nonomuraea angiospora]|uniref:Uncharacterized protein n=1 Tax=Nonomuraea angiospora TaxID=46172 RepID=A0ABR9LPU4_9ACTN|nr:hypothetical protein [Nonomuraea angiospora]MBE1582297.1 hypothetical protein [Nonomuraea angiospora]